MTTTSMKYMNQAKQKCKNKITDDLLVQMVNMVQNYPVIWNTSLRSFKDLHKKTEAWRRISQALNCSGKSKIVFLHCSISFLILDNENVGK